MTEQTTDDTIRVNSVWRAKDGRLMRVAELKGDRVQLQVISFVPPRQRTWTVIAAKEFGAGKFLQKEADFG